MFFSHFKSDKMWIKIQKKYKTENFWKMSVKLFSLSKKKNFVCRKHFFAAWFTSSLGSNTNVIRIWSYWAQTFLCLHFGCTVCMFTQKMCALPLLSLRSLNKLILNCLWEEWTWKSPSFLGQRLWLSSPIWNNFSDSHISPTIGCLPVSLMHSSRGQRLSEYTYSIGRVASHDVVYNTCPLLVCFIDRWTSALNLKGRNKIG